MARVLTVDDSRAIRMIVSKVISEMGFEIAEAEDGEKGLACLEEVEFDLIILDVTMPVLDGPGMLAKMRAAGNTTPVLMLTSESKRTIVAELMKLKIEDYILKPFKNDELKAKITKILKQRNPDVLAALSAAATVTAAAAPRAQEAMAAANETGGGRQFADVLVVDDMENVSKKLRTLMPPHITMMTALSGQAGLKMARESTFRLILIDRELPDLAGPALLQQLRVLQPNAACLAMTLKSSNNVSKEVKQEGFDDALFKPFGQDSIDDMLQAYFQVSELLTRQDNVLSASAFQGRADRMDRYYGRLSQLLKDAVKEAAEACFESVIFDAGKLPADPSRMAQLVTELQGNARAFGLAVRLVGPVAVRRALETFSDTKDIPVLESVSEAQRSLA